MSEAATVAKPNGMRKASVPPERNSCQKTLQASVCKIVPHRHSYYKGSWRPMEWFRGVQLRPQHLAKNTQQQTSWPHWIIMKWNAGGLTTSVFQECETNARENRLDIFLIQETKWKTEATWSNRGFHYIHSLGRGTLDRGDKMMILRRIRDSSSPPPRARQVPAS